jgi:hypothetical protein
LIERLNNMGPDGLQGDRELADRLVAEFEERVGKMRIRRGR